LPAHYTADDASLSSFLASCILDVDWQFESGLAAEAIASFPALCHLRVASARVKMMHASDR
jgi:hypothetical protein